MEWEEHEAEVLLMERDSLHANCSPGALAGWLAGWLPLYGLKLDRATT
jgi:hypothetical protein